MQTFLLNYRDLAWQIDFNAKENTTFWELFPESKIALDNFNYAKAGSILVVQGQGSNFQYQLFKQQIHNLHKLDDLELNYLFGAIFYDSENKEVKQSQGILSQIDTDTTLVIDIAKIFQYGADLWFSLKNALKNHKFHKIISNNIPDELDDENFHKAQNCEFKIILQGNAVDIETFFGLEPDLDNLANFVNFCPLLIVDKTNQPLVAGYLQTLAKQFGLGKFSNEAINIIFRQLVRISETKNLIDLNFTRLEKWFVGIKIYFEKNNFNLDEIDAENVTKFFIEHNQLLQNIAKITLNEKLSGNLFLETTGEKIGQINALAVIEDVGNFSAFGEILRVTCNVSKGEGEIIDLESKISLGGSLHAKGILIAQYCLMNLLNLPTQLPFSASIVFEQSYSEIDGDSSSLAIFCVLLSALTKLPLPQNIALTGAIDQKGNVLAVGGVNEKIEGFFDLCQAQNLTGTQGVIIPKICAENLSLQPKVLEQIKEQKFHIYGVSNVLEAIEILFGKPLFNEPNKPYQQSLEDIIYHNFESNSGSWFAWLLSKFSKKSRIYNF